MTRSVVISPRFVGPPNSGHGGYSAGIVAAALSGGPVEVTLRQPPPVGRPLHISVENGRAAALDGDIVIAEAVETDAAGDAPAPVSFDEARQAAAAFDLERYTANHPFPGCFGCGPGRQPGDGLRLFPAPLSRGVVGWPWIPDPSLAAGDGALDPAFVWAALDCQSGLAWMDGQDPPPPIVLGRMTAAVHRRPGPGEHLVVAGWVIEETGRKVTAGSVVWDDNGEQCAVSRATWIMLDAKQGSTFGAMTNPPR